MVVADGNGRPLATLIDSAQKSEVQLAEPVLDRVRVARRHGRPKRRPKSLVADKGYDSDQLRAALRKRSIRPVVPFKRNRRPRPGPKPDLSGYRDRWRIERLFAWLGNYDRLVTRKERNAQTYLAFLLLACAMITLNAITG
jgi:transposase